MSIKTETESQEDTKLSLESLSELHPHSNSHWLTSESTKEKKNGLESNYQSQVDMETTIKMRTC